ncbi:hypothetical protein M673_09400 [Aureimonas sp. AU20]|nr:hypothetical protein M673_09400 [Aureimonas sp. AU20]
MTEAASGLYKSDMFAGCDMMGQAPFPSRGATSGEKGQGARVFYAASGGAIA